jgi:hypothetical protein
MFEEFAVKGSLMLLIIFLMIFGYIVISAFIDAKIK